MFYVRRRDAQHTSLRRRQLSRWHITLFSMSVRCLQARKVCCVMCFVYVLLGFNSLTME